MAGNLRVTNRTYLYTLGLDSPDSVHIPALSLQVSAFNEDLRVDVELAAHSGQYVQSYNGGLVDLVREAGPAGLLPPVWFGDDSRRAMTEYASLFQGGDTSPILLSFLESEEVLVPVFGSAPSELVPLRQIIGTEGTKAAILIGPATAALASGQYSVAVLALFYLGGVVVLKVVNPVLDAVGEGLSAAVHRSFKLPPRS